MSSLQCNTQQLAQILDGSVALDELDSIESHLEHCNACREQLDLLSLRVTHVGPFEAGLSDDELDKEWESVELFDEASWRKEGSASDESTDAAIDSVIARLNPSDDPRMLGRFANYEIMGVVGAGGMGVVMKGYESALNRFVGIKVLSPFLAASSLAKKRFIREGRSAASVLHPNVVPIHQVAEADGIPYLVMPYLGSGNLQDRIDLQGRLDPESVVRIGMQIATGLAAAHEQGLIHRDIKPANILLDQDTDRVIVTDFGLARTVDDFSLTMTGSVAGTPPYMSPEQASGDSLDFRSDLFSLGSLMHAMCTGVSPFHAETHFGALKNVIEMAPRKIQEINPSVPDWLVVTIEKLHEKEPSRRFQSAGELASLLAGCLAHLQQPNQNPLPDSIRRLRTARRRISTPILGVALVTLLIVTCLGVFMLDDLSRWTTANQLDQDVMTKAFSFNGDDASVAEVLAAWKEMPVGSEYEKRWEEELRTEYQRQLEETRPSQRAEVERRWAAQLLPVALGGVVVDKADFLWEMSLPGESIRVADRLAADGKTTEPIGWEMQVVHAFACSRREFVDDAERELDLVMLKAEVNRANATDDGEAIPFFGREQSYDGVLHECSLYREILKSIRVQTIDSNGPDFEEPDSPSGTEDDGVDFDVDFFADDWANFDGEAFVSEFESLPDSPSLVRADEKYLALFEVDGNRFVSKAVRQHDAAELSIPVWERINALFPTMYRREIVQFNLHDGRRWAGAFSGDGSNDVERDGYRLSIAKYLAEEEDELKDATRIASPRRGTLDWTLVHEMGHYICLRSGAIELFSQEFDGDGREQPSRREDPDDYAEDGSPTVNGNFVTSYAERTPGDEEAVESFTTYMLIPQLPENDSLAAQKIRFFESLPGMHELRTHIQSMGQRRQ